MILKKYRTLFLLLLRLLEIILFLFSILIKDRRKTRCNKILIAEPYQMGDLISLVYLIDPLAKQYPDYEIYILGKENYSNIFTFDKRISGIINIDLKWTTHGKSGFFSLKFFYDLIQLARYRKFRFRYSFDTRGDLKIQFLLGVIGAQNIIGYVDGVGSNIRLAGLLLDKPVRRNINYLHRYEWNRFLLTALDMSESKLFPIELPLINSNELRQISKDKNKDVFNVLIHLGSGWSFRQWDLLKWKSLIEKMTLDSSNVIKIIAGKGDKQYFDSLSTLMEENNSVTYMVTEDLHSLFKCISECDIFIGLDSGPLHIADTMNKPALALFGPGIPELWKPYSKNSKYIQNIIDFPCYPCSQRVCLRPYKSCMSKIEVENVYLTFLEIKKSI